MGKQMEFMLNEIDRAATKAMVEEKLNQYQLYLLAAPIDIEPKITSTFTITPPTYNNQFHSTTEEMAIKKIDQERKREKFISWVQRCINKLPLQERSVIIKSYLSDNIYEYEVYNELGFSERKYYRVKSRAIYTLAFIMGVEVYKKDSENEGGEAV
ncbi:ArpU family phage packaging/lysis transcriptional regulator [Gracilibacillus xinjiangensis]|uniref:ArpU family phage packaging/lysis transcriptional regulator n=1 Tax=Gracilibacillus xinjiangensis TaxID=1193282 RepID=A0ABV8WW91_9BACI